MAARKVVPVIVCLGALIAGCSSGHPAAAPTGNTSAASATSNADQAAVAQYLARVNALCDALLPKVLAAIHGGHPGTYPVATYYAEVAVTSKLEADFDRQLAQVPIPPQAAAQHAALQGYLDYANQLNAQRRATAAKGQAAFDAETKAEAAQTPTDPHIAARNAAGFNESCNAR